MFKLRKAFLLTIVLLLICDIFCFKHIKAEEEYNGEGSYGVLTIRQHGNTITATEEEFAYARNSLNTSLGWSEFYSDIYFEYQNFKPNTTYTSKIYNIHRADQTGVISTGPTITTDESGSGNFTFSDEMAVFDSALGTYDVSIEFYIDDVKQFEYGGRGNSMSYLFGGSAESKMYMKGDSDAVLSHDVVDDPNEVRTFYHRLKVYDLSPNTQYNIRSWVAKLVAWGSSDFQAIRMNSNVVNTFTTDEKGYAELDYQIYEGTDLNKTGYYIPFYVIDAVDNSNDTLRRWFNYSIAYFIKQEEVFTMIDNTEYVEPDANKVRVSIQNYIKGSDEILKNSTLTLYKGESLDSAEKIETWKTNDENKNLLLEVGKYILVQDDVENPYILAKEVYFELVDDDAENRNNNFVAYTTVENTEYNHINNVFYVKKAGEELDGTGDIAYCINLGISDPTSIDMENLKPLYYSEKDIYDENLLSYLKSPKTDVDTTRRMLKSIMSAGFPNNYHGIKEKYNLSDENFKYVTQDAVHYYTDSMEYGLARYSNEDVYNAYRDLISNEYPTDDNMTVKVLVPENRNYQAVVSTVLRQKEIIVPIRIENYRIYNFKKVWNGEEAFEEVDVKISWNGDNNKIEELNNEDDINYVVEDGLHTLTFKLKKEDNYERIISGFDIPDDALIEETNNLESYGYYEVEKDGDNITITNNQETEIIVKKLWVDDNEEDRPESISVQLLKNDEVIETVKLNKENNWRYEFNNLLKYENNEEIKYSISEVVVDGYKSSIDKVDNIYTITNAREEEIIEYTKIEISKIWEDENNANNTRPESITIGIYNGEELIREIELNKENNFKYEINDLPKYQDGTEIVYTINEIDIPDGYTKSVDGYTIINTLIPEEEVVKYKAKLVKENSFGYLIHGALIKLNDDNNEEVDFYTSDEEHIVELEAGIYEFIEEEAPFGFKEVKPFKFEINDKGEINILSDTNDAYILDNTLRIKDERDLLGAKQTLIYKVDEEGNPISGAKLIILDHNNNVHDEWISDNNPHTIELLPGEYTIKELEAPKDYLAINDFKIKVDDNGSITIIDSNNNILSSNSSSLTITDKKEKQEEPKKEEEKKEEDKPVIIPDKKEEPRKEETRKPVVVNTGVK